MPDVTVMAVMGMAVMAGVPRELPRPVPLPAPPPATTTMAAIMIATAGGSAQASTRIEFGGMGRFEPAIRSGLLVNDVGDVR